MNCHSGTENGHGYFAVAGTVYNSNFGSVLTNATVNLFSGPDGSGNLLRTIEVDFPGNFYDGKNDGLTITFYTIVISPTGA